jgi:hypothetical protein
MLNNSVLLSRIFSAAFERHQQNRHNADYEVCTHWLCRLAWCVENWLWYGGEAET